MKVSQSTDSGHRRFRFFLPWLVCLGAFTAVAPGAPRLGSLPRDSDSATTAGIALTEVVADAQGRALVEVVLASAGVPVSALQFDVSYQESALSFAISRANAVASAGKSIWIGNPAPGTERILIVGLNQTALTDGVLATLAVEAVPGTAAGVYPLGLTNALASDPRGEAVPLSTNDGGLVVPGAGVSVPTIADVRNEATRAAGPLAPGEIVIIDGNSLADSTPGSVQLTATGVVADSLGATRVLFDDIPAPLLYTTAGQVSAIVPYGVSGQSQTSVQVEYQGVRSTPLSVSLAATSPGIFTLNLSGTGQGAIVNQDGSVNGVDNPAALGDIISIYGTGEGQTVPPGEDGIVVTAADLRQPLLTVTARIGGEDAEVLYAGSASNEVAGVLQVNVRIPLRVVPGPAVPVTIDIGGSSQLGVTLAVQ